MLPDPNPPSALTGAPPASSRRAMLRATLRRPSTLIILALLALMAWQWLETRERFEGLEVELAKRLGEGDAVAREARTLVRQSQDGLQLLTAKVGGLEAKLAEIQGQQGAIEAMYQDLSRSRDDRLVAELEQSLSLAAQQLAIGGNVQAALIALQGADERLVRNPQVHWLAIRKLINRDIDRLKALPAADVPGISLKLDGVIASMDTMPLAHEQRPKVEPVVKPAHSPAEASFWQGLANDVWSEAKQMIRVERMDRPTPALLSPPQAFFLRENLKLRLLDARLSLLQRDGRGFREDVNQARDWLDSYFDGRARTVQSAAATLKGLAGIELNQDLPTLADTLAALRNLKAASVVREVPAPPARPRSGGEGAAATRGAVPGATPGSASGRPGAGS